MGEAAKHLPAAFRTEHMSIDWRSLIGMRDRLIHGYFGVDYEIVWDAVQNSVPELRRQVAELLEA
ncbi:MAG: HepT-like ribonuclease domain-containing protein [Gemmatimonadota bacterium]